MSFLVLRRSAQSQPFTPPICYAILSRSVWLGGILSLFARLWTQMTPPQLAEGNVDHSITTIVRRHWSSFLVPVGALLFYLALLLGGVSGKTDGGFPSSRLSRRANFRETGAALWHARAHDLRHDHRSRIDYVDHAGREGEL